MRAMARAAPVGPCGHGRRARGQDATHSAMIRTHAAKGDAAQARVLARAGAHVAVAATPKPSRVSGATAGATSRFAITPQVGSHGLINVRAGSVASCATTATLTAAPKARTKREPSFAETSRRALSRELHSQDRFRRGRTLGRRLASASRTDSPSLASEPALQRARTQHDPSSRKDRQDETN